LVGRDNDVGEGAAVQHSSSAQTSHPSVSDNHFNCTVPPAHYPNCLDSPAHNRSPYGWYTSPSDKRGSLCGEHKPRGFNSPDDPHYGTKVVVKQPPPHTKNEAGAGGGEHNARPPTTPNGITLPAFYSRTIATKWFWISKKRKHSMPR
jgi:hypothetical protein